MKFNKLILPITLITPLFVTSCNNDGSQISGLTIDAYETIFAYSQTCSTSLTIGVSDVEFVDDFKKEYFTFDNPNDFKGKSYEINKTSSKTITVTFTGAYTGTELSKSDTKQIKYKISKSAFKNNKLKDDATGIMHMKWDNVSPTSTAHGTTGIGVSCIFTQDDVPSTKVTLSSSFKTKISKSFNDYGSPTCADATIDFSQTTVEGKVYLNINIAGLSNQSGSGYAITIPNKVGAILFDNLPDNHALKFAISRETGKTEYELVNQVGFYFEKIA